LPFIPDERKMRVACAAALYRACRRRTVVVAQTMCSRGGAVTRRFKTDMLALAFVDRRS
jgi:hypothetical protein